MHAVRVLPTPSTPDEVRTTSLPLKKKEKEGGEKTPALVRSHPGDGLRGFRNAGREGGGKVPFGDAAAVPREKEGVSLLGSPLAPPSQRSIRKGWMGEAAFFLIQSVGV